MIEYVRNWHLEQTREYIINGEKMVLTLSQYDEVVKKN